MGRLLAWSSFGTMGCQWLEEATTLPWVGLLDGPDWGQNWTLPRRDRLVADVVNGDVHTWLGHAAKKKNKRKWLWRGACSGGTGNQDRALEWLHGEVLELATCTFTTSWTQ